VNNVTRNRPPAQSTDTGAPASGDDGNILAFQRRNPGDQVETASTNEAAESPVIAGKPSDTAVLPVAAGSPTNTSLLILDGASRELAAAKRIDEVISIRDKAIGLAAYARQASDRQLEVEAAAIRMVAERTLGQMMRELKMIGLSKGGRPKTGVGETPVSDQPPTLSEFGIDKNLAKRARAAAAPSDEEFNAKLAAMIEAGRSRTGSRTKSLGVKARARKLRAGRRERKRCTYLEVLSQISAVCNITRECSRRTSRRRKPTRQLRRSRRPSAS
jgi:hypothetical protein